MENVISYQTRTWTRLNDEDRILQIRLLLNNPKDTFLPIAINELFIWTQEMLFNELPYYKFINGKKMTDTEKIAALFLISKYVIPIIDEEPSPDNKEYTLSGMYTCFRRKDKLFVKRSGKVLIAGFIVPFHENMKYIKDAATPDTLFLGIPEPVRIPAEYYTQVSNIDDAFEIIKFDDVNKVKYQNIIKRRIEHAIERSALKYKIENVKDYHLFKKPELHVTLVNVSGHKLGLRTDINEIFDYELFDPEYDVNRVYTADPDVKLAISRLLDTGAFIHNINDKDRMIIESESTAASLINEYHIRKFSERPDILEKMKPGLKIISSAATLIKYGIDYGRLKIDPNNSYTKEYVAPSKSLSILEYYSDFMDYICDDLFKKELVIVRKIVRSKLMSIIKYAYQLSIKRHSAQLVTKVTNNGNFISADNKDICGLILRIIKKFQIASYHVDNIKEVIERHVLPIEKYLNTLPPLKVTSGPYTIYTNEREEYIPSNPIAYKEGQKKIRKENIQQLHLGEKFQSKITQDVKDNLSSIINKIINKIKENRSKKQLPPLDSRWFDYLKNIGFLKNKHEEDSVGSDYEKGMVLEKYNNIAYYLIRTAAVELLLSKKMGDHLDEYVYKIDRIFNTDAAKVNLIREAWFTLIDKYMEDPEDYLKSKLDYFSWMDISRKSVEFTKMREQEIREARLSAYLSMTPEAKLESNIDNMTYEERADFLDQLIRENEERYAVEAQIDIMDE